jgi:hypothetical protein
MRRPTVIALAAALGGAFAVAAACVPADTRPPPGVLTFTVSPSPAVANGVVTADGWTIAFDRVLVAIGNEGLGNTCTIYGEANYDRILDVTNDGGQHLGIVHGLGQCDVDFRIGAPSADAIPGPGVSEDDKTRLRTPGGDAYVPLGGIAADVALTASRDGVTKHFHLSFRQRIRYQHCSLDPDAGLPAVDLQSNTALTYDIRIEGEALLRGDLDASAPLRFDPFAAADTNGDGTVTLEELGAVSIDSIRDGGPFEAGSYDFDDAGQLVRGKPIVITTLADYVYELLAPTLARFRGTGTCLTSGRRPGGG